MCILIYTFCFSFSSSSNQIPDFFSKLPVTIDCIRWRTNKNLRRVSFFVMLYDSSEIGTNFLLIAFLIGNMLSLLELSLDTVLGFWACLFPLIMRALHLGALIEQSKFGIWKPNNACILLPTILIRYCLINSRSSLSSFINYYLFFLNLGMECFF